MTAPVRERPLIMSGPMVRAILDGTKTQTRRVVKGEPGRVHWNPIMLHGYAGWTDEHGRPTPCPYGRPGDRLWVREQLRGDGQPGDRRIGITRYGSDGEMVLPRVCCGNVICTCGDPSSRMDHIWGWKRTVLPARYMPRWAWRLTLEVTAVRVERVAEISRADAIAEGCLGHGYSNEFKDDSEAPEEQYRTLWDFLNASRGFGWATNPWVWVVEFAARRPGDDATGGQP